MNFLAHFYLSENDEELLLGNLLGEFVKGRVERFAPPGITEQIRNGIRLHRAIDFFTDQHPTVGQSKSLLRPRYGRLAGVIVDVFYDHFLAVHWGEYATIPLACFTQDVYEALQRNQYRLPPDTRPLVDSMRRHDWLTNYAHPAGIEWTLRGLSRRAPVAVGIGTATQELVQHYESFDDDFRAFFPELREHCRQFVQSYSPPHS